MKKIILVILIALTGFIPEVQALDYGLSIQSYPKPYGQYTALELNEGKPVILSGNPLSIDFQIFARPENTMGQILRIEADNDFSAAIIFAVGAGSQAYPTLQIGDLSYPLSKKPVHVKEWVPVSLTIYPLTSKIIATYNDDTIEIPDQAVASITSLKIGFGAATFTKYQARDVASVNIRDIVITNGNSRVFSWPLARHEHDISYDELHHAKAVAVNPQWLIEDARKWHLLYRHHFPKHVSTAFDPAKSTFYFAGNNRWLYSFNAITGKSDSIGVKGGFMMATFPNQLIFLPSDNQLLSYHLGDNRYSAFDFETQTWDADYPATNDHYYWHNSNNLDSAANKLYSFGGYGHYHLNNDLIISDFNTKTQVRKTISGIDPKRMHSAALVDSFLYVFGGVGNPSGRQEMNFRNENGFYRISLKDFTAEKIWEMEPVEAFDYTFAENMIYNPADSSFYVFSNCSQGALMKVSPADSTMTYVSEPIDANLNAQYPYFNIYPSFHNDCIYAVIETSDISDHTTVSVYALPFPVYSQAEFEAALNDIDSSADDKKSGSLLNGILIIVLIISLIIILVIVIRNRRKSTKPITPANTPTADINAASLPVDPTLPASSVQLADENNNEESEDQSEAIKLEVSNPKSTIRLLGGLRVFDADGVDISKEFSPTLKTLLVLLIIHTMNDPKGLSNKKLIEVLWDDKSDLSAKNNRNVNVRKLRILLERVGDISIHNENRSFMKINFGDNTLCDYCEAMNLFNEAKTPENIERLLNILLVGALLPNMEYEWLDPYKAQFSDKTIDILSELLNSTWLSDDTKLRIADTLFLHDYLNEKAMIAKCRILYRHGKKGLVKKVYDSFGRSYTESFGVPYPKSLIDIVNDNSADPESPK